MNQSSCKGIKGTDPTHSTAESSGSDERMQRCGGRWRKANIYPLERRHDFSQ